MPTSIGSFNVDMISSRQKRQLESDGYFKTSTGKYRDAQGNYVTPEQSQPTVAQPKTVEPNVDKVGQMISTPIQSPTPINQVQPTPTINLPEPNALDTKTAFGNTIQGAVDSAKNNLTTVLSGQRKEIQTEIDALTKKQDEALAAGKELTTPFRADLEAKQREKLKINENFQANQKLTNELEGLLTQSNELINIATGRQVSGKVLEKSLTKTLADVQARAGVIQAVMAARNDQITVAENLIDRTVEAIVADRNDELSYYNTIIDLSDRKLINLESEKYDLAKTERDQAIKDVESAQATADYIKGLMISPETAQFMADAGVSLTDSIDGIKAKMAKQSKVQEVTNMRNSLVDAGYEISPVPVPGGIEVQAGDQTLYAKVRPGSELDLRLQAQQANIAQSYASARASNASAARNETGRLLDLAAAGDVGAISALGLTMPDGETTPSPDMLAYAAEYASSGKLPSSSSLPKGITVGAIAELARSMPKPDGAIVSTNTGVVSDNLSAEERKGIVAMNEIVNDTLPFMIEKWNELQQTDPTALAFNPLTGGKQTGLLGGIKSSVVPSDAMTQYEQARDEFLSKLLVARSGAAVTEQEYARYRALVPGKFNNTLGLGNKGDVQLSNLDSLMVTNFDNFLNSNQLSVYGYSTIDTPEGKFTVGDVIENEYGQQGIIQPDGSVTLINL